MSIKKGIKLKFAISLLVTLTVCSTTVVNWYLSIHALKNSLTENYLENNYQYAKKVTFINRRIVGKTEQLFMNTVRNLT